jgi:arylsulfatase A-like enzyme
MRDKGNCTYRQQNHIPLMIVHPAYAGGKECAAITSQIDLVPTLIGLTGKDQASKQTAAQGLKGKDFSGLLKFPESAQPNSVRSAALFCYNMISYLDDKWARRIFPTMVSGKDSPGQLQALLEKDKPDLSNRCGIRSIWDGRYRFSRYFAPNAFNTPTTLESLLANNDLEVYDLLKDPNETKNLALDPQANRSLIMALNNSMNQLLAEEVGIDDGSFLPIRNGTLLLAPANER